MPAVMSEVAPFTSFERGLYEYQQSGVRLLLLQVLQKVCMNTRSQE